MIAKVFKKGQKDKMTKDKPAEKPAEQPKPAAAAAAKTQKAFMIHIDHKAIEEVEIPIPEIKDTEVLLKVYGAGVCHSDVTVKNGYVPFLKKDGFIGGHEVAGKAVKIGSSVTEIKLNGRYCVSAKNPCLKCEACLNGHSNVCLKTFQSFGLARPGGWQQFMVVDKASSLIEVPDNVSLQTAAVLSDAGITPYHAIKRVNLTPISKVLIFGAGGLGLNAIQIAKSYGSEVVVVDLKEDLRETVMGFGVDDFVTDLSKATEYTKGYFDVSIDMVCTDTTFALASGYLKNRGVVVAIGINPKVSINLMHFCLKEITIQSNLYGTANELKECLELVSRGVWKPQLEVLPFKDVGEVIDGLDSGKISGRVCFNPNEDDDDE